MTRAPGDSTPGGAVSPAEQIANIVQESPESFGGIYFDDGVYVVCIVRDESRALATQIRSELGAGVPLRFEVVDQSRRTLLRWKSHIALEVERLAGQGVKLESIGPDVQTNTVLVQIREDSPEDAEALLRDYFPRMVLTIVRETLNARPG